jgi:hypothetical protein
MALPKYPIKKIPNTEPDAVPALWNETYEEIDQNLNNLDVRLVARESEINAARGGESSLAARIGDLDEQIQGLDPTCRTPSQPRCGCDIGSRACKSRALENAASTNTNRRSRCDQPRR